jgi:serine/threonine protein kinase
MACEVQRSGGIHTYEYWSKNREMSVWSTAAKSSKYVVQLYDACYNPHTNQIRMYTELCRGGDIYQLMEETKHWKDSRIHPLIIYHIGLQIAWGLVDIHKSWILHRDLKVDNVLMTMKITEAINESLW